jgi:hypothetical protein
MAQSGDIREESITRFRSLLEQRAWSYRGALLSLACVKVGEDLQLLRGSVRFTRDGDVDVSGLPPGPLDYGQLVFLRARKSVEEAVAFVEAVTRTGTSARIGDFVARCGPLPDFFRVGGIPNEGWPNPIGSGRASQWPSSDFAWSAGGPNQPGTLRDPYGILVSLREPPIIKATQAIDDWTGHPWASRLNPSSNMMLVVLPDFRARIKSALITSTGVKIEVEKLANPEIELVYQATAGDRIRETAQEVRLIPAGADVVIQDLSTLFHFFVLSAETGAVLDWLSFDVEQPIPSQVTYESGGLRTAQLLEGGETQYVEWKTAVGQLDAIGEFFETVTAFANTNDGTILVGVDDHGVVQGLGTENFESVRTRILDLAETRCEPVPEGIEFSHDRFDEKDVMILTVRRGANPPYLLRRDGPTSRTEIYVRRGDKDRPARRAEIDIWYAARAPQNAPAFR